MIIFSVYIVIGSTFLLFEAVYQVEVEVRLQVEVIDNILFNLNTYIDYARRKRTNAIHRRKIKNTYAFRYTDKKIMSIPFTWGGLNQKFRWGRGSQPQSVPNSPI